MANANNSIKKQNWVSNFQLIGKPVINDYSFKIDEQSQKSDWIYNSLNLGVDCGEKHGVVYAEMMGGYSPSKGNTLYKIGVDDNGNADFSKQEMVAWDDRFDENVLEGIADTSFLRVGLEVTDKGKTYTERFLSEYDAIAYIKEHLSTDTVINVRGQLKYSLYNDKVQVRKEIQSIYLSRVEDPADFKATFTQSILVDKDSASLKDVDKSTGILPITARVLDYMRDYKGVEVRGQWPYTKEFEYKLDLTKPDMCKKIVSSLFSPKKNVMQITFEGDFIEGGATVTVTKEDIPEDIMSLVDIGVYTLDEALAECSTNGPRIKRMVLRKPITRKEGEGDKQTTVLQMFPDAYEEDDLDMSWVFKQVADEDDEDLPFDEDKKSDSGDDDDDWLDLL